MNKTKRKILDAGRELFNQYGLSNVSQRRITDFLKISPGNLTYHFKKSDDIVEALYFELVGKFDELFSSLERESKDFSILLTFTGRMFALMNDYRFFFIDYVHLMRVNEKIAGHYKALQKGRKEQFVNILTSLSEQGYLKEEELPSEYNFLYERLQVMTDFFFSSRFLNEVKDRSSEEKQFAHSFIYAIYPFLTEKGKLELQSWFRSTG